MGILRNLEFGMSGRKNETCPFWHRGWLASQTNCKNWAQNNDIDSTKCSTVVNAPSPGISVFGWLCPSTAVYGVYCANMTHVWYNSETTVFCKEWPKKSAHSGHSVTVFFLLRYSVTVFFLLRFCKRHKKNVLSAGVLVYRGAKVMPIEGFAANNWRYNQIGQQSVTFCQDIPGCLCSVLFCPRCRMVQAGFTTDRHEYLPSPS